MYILYHTFKDLSSLFLKKIRIFLSLCNLYKVFNNFMIVLCNLHKFQKFQKNLQKVLDKRAEMCYNRITVKGNIKEFLQQRYTGLGTEKRNLTIYLYSEYNSKSEKWLYTVIFRIHFLNITNSKYELVKISNFSFH